MGQDAGGTGTTAVQAKARVTEDGTRGTGRRAKERGSARAGVRGQGRDLRARARRGKATQAPGDRRSGAQGPRGARRVRGEGRGAGRPRDQTSSRCGASPPVSNKCQHSTPTTTTTTTPTSTTSTPDAVDLMPPNPNPPGPHTSRPPPPPPHGSPPRGPAPAAPEPRAEPARMAAAPAQPQGAGEARGWPGDRDWGEIPDPLVGEALPLVVEVYGWLTWASSGTNRGPRTRPFDAVLLRRDGGNREVPWEGRVAQEDHERVLRTVIRAGLPNTEPGWPAFLEGRAVLRITDAEANNWLPRALRYALTHWRYPGLG